MLSHYRPATLHVVQPARQDTGWDIFNLILSLYIYIVPYTTYLKMTTLPITLVGGTGLTGSATLLALLQSPSAVNLTAITRKEHPAPVQNYTNASTSYTNRALTNLADAITSTEGVGPNGGVYISCLGTTRGQAGGFEKQKEIDLYLNRDLVTKAKADGAKTVSQPLPYVEACIDGRQSWYHQVEPILTP